MDFIWFESLAEIVRDYNDVSFFVFLKQAPIKLLTVRMTWAFLACLVDFSPLTKAIPVTMLMVPPSLVLVYNALSFSILK